MFKAISSFLVFASCSCFVEVLCSGSVRAEELRLPRPQLTSKYKSKAIKTSWQYSDDIQFYGNYSLAKSVIGSQFAGYRSLASGHDGQARAKGHLISRNDEALGGSLGVFILVTTVFMTPKTHLGGVAMPGLCVAIKSLALSVHSIMSKDSIELVISLLTWMCRLAWDINLSLKAGIDHSMNQRERMYLFWLLSCPWLDTGCRIISINSVLVRGSALL